MTDFYKIDLSRFHKPDRAFFKRDVVKVAKDLLCGYIKHATRHGIVGGLIVEDEAYSMYDDPGAHSFRGVTERNKVMFGPPGHAYMYFTYGNHWMFNIVAEKEGIGAAVLVRALQPVEGIAYMWERRPKAKKECDLTSGPGKLAAALNLGKNEYGVDLMDGEFSVLLPEPEYRKKLIREYGGVTVTTRIGLTQGAELPYRFYLTEHPCVSVRKKIQKTADK
jgi:DNA-3-methyladenine glycosylase